SGGRHAPRLGASGAPRPALSTGARHAGELAVLRCRRVRIIDGRVAGAHRIVSPTLAPPRRPFRPARSHGRHDLAQTRAECARAGEGARGYGHAKGRVVPYAVGASQPDRQIEVIVDVAVRAIDE